MKVAFIYIPVLHEGYRRFFRETKPDRVYLLAQELLSSEFDHLRKDIRALPISEVAVALDSWRVAPVIGLLSELGDIKALMRDLEDSDKFVVTDDEVGRWVEEQFLKNTKVTRYTTFLRWDKAKSIDNKTVKAKQISAKDVARLFAVATSEANRSSDWWRQVGAAVAKNNKLLLSAHNAHLPTEYEPYLSGDGRSLFHKGEHMDKTSAIHAEASIIAQAARRGLSLQDTEMFVTTFPCPTCAKLIAASGISKLYFQEGYAVFDGEQILKAAGVEILRVG